MPKIAIAEIGSNYCPQIFDILTREEKCEVVFAETTPKLLKESHNSCKILLFSANYLRNQLLLQNATILDIFQLRNKDDEHSWQMEIDFKINSDFFLNHTDIASHILELVHAQNSPKNPYTTPLNTGEPSSFANLTMTVRLPNVIRELIHDYEAENPQIGSCLSDIIESIIANEEIMELDHYICEEDQEFLKQLREIRRQCGRAQWLSCPWYFAESYLWRKIVEISHYDPKDCQKHRDPFLRRKEAELQKKEIWEFCIFNLKASDMDLKAALRRVLLGCIWSNRMDLVYYEVSSHHKKGNDGLLIKDDSDAVMEFILSKKPKTVSLICDNAGAEILQDLILCDYLLQQRLTEQITLHLKGLPTFVSDATKPDVIWHIEFLCTFGCNKLSLNASHLISDWDVRLLQGMGTRLREYIETRRIMLEPHYFWIGCNFFDKLPIDIFSKLVVSPLVLIKGDANYRRMLWDSAIWKADTLVRSSCAFFPSNFVMLRTLKSPPIVGLPSEMESALAAEDVDWRTNGKRGVIECLFAEYQCYSVSSDGYY